MTELIQNLGDLNDVKVVGLAVLIVLAFVLGWIVPRRILNDVIAQRDRALDLLEGKTQRDEAIMDLLLAIKNGPREGAP